MPTNPSKPAAVPAFRGLPKTFEGLCRRLPLRPIRDDVDLGNAREYLDALAGHELTDDQADYLDALSTLVETYESEHHAIETQITRGQFLRHLMDEHRLTTTDVGKLLGSNRSLVSHLTSGNRGFTWSNAKALGENFGLPPQAFME